jgi:proteasome lid subunit RPN8/RPN11
LDQIVIPSQIREALMAHALFSHPEEACGLLASDAEGRLRMAYPLTNILHSPTNYTIEPREHYHALKHADARGWELTGVFHSHPYSAAFPSATDIRLSVDPTWLYLIVGMENIDTPVLRGFRIGSGTVTEEALTVDQRRLDR